MKKLLVPWDTHTTNLNIAVIYYIGSVVVPDGGVVSMPD